MPSNSQFAQLYLYNTTTDKDQLFMDFRDNLAGTKMDSNMQKIDKIFSTQDGRIGILEKLPHTVTIKAISDDAGNNYVASNVTNFKSYILNMLLLVYFSVNNGGLTTLNVNNTGVTSIMKIDAVGNPINLEANDLKKNVGYLLQYDGSKLVMVGEKFESVITDTVEPFNQPTGGIWNKLLGGGGCTMHVKKADGTYSAIPPTTSSLLVSFNDGTTLEAFKTQVAQYHKTNDTNITNIKADVTSVTGKVNTLTTDYNAFKTDTTTYHTNNTKDINTLKGNITTLSSEIDDVAADVVTANNKISILETSNTKIINGTQVVGKATNATNATTATNSTKLNNQAASYYATATSVTNLTTTVNAKAAKSKYITVTLTAAGWAGTAVPFTQTVTATGVTATSNGIVGLSLSITKAQLDASTAAQLIITGQAANKVTISAFAEKPTIDIPISVTIIG